MCKYTRFVKGLGFDGVQKGEPSRDPKHVKAIHYEDIDPVMLRASLGRSRKHKDGKFAFVVSNTQGVFVSTVTKRVLLCNGVDAVQRMLKSFGR
jgi:hypothetical protein